MHMTRLSGRFHVITCLSLLVGSLAGTGCTQSVPATPARPGKPHAIAPVEPTSMPVEPPVASAEPQALQRPYLLHLPGIGGKRSIDRSLVGGLSEGGIDAEVEIYDWTCDDPGLDALLARERNDGQAQVVADMIERQARADPHRPIYLTGHSGGAGIAVWALEKLPDDVRIDSLMLLAPALSPEYDLSTALAHVRGHCYVLFSEHDPVLGLGTRLFGTIDGVKTEAAGRVGFARPAGADEEQYKKLVPIAYDPAWVRLRNIGDHIGPMMRPFARQILAPLLSTGILPKLPPLRLPATIPTTKSATTQAVMP
jgi:pimeloyl-ACP methyl ester carboxylesterase